jgi:uroporphyrinogen III methyltransferase/synthase
VRIFWDALRDAGHDARALAGIRVAAVGPATADALLEHGIVVDVTPDRFVAESLLAALAARADVRGARVLYAAAEGARDVLPRGLEELGATVERVSLYCSVPDADGAAAFRERLAQSGADVITFTSASTVKAFVDAADAGAAQSILVASIGPITSAAARDAGLDVAIEAATSTIDGLVDAVIDHFERQPGASE